MTEGIGLAAAILVTLLFGATILISNHLRDGDA